MRIALTQRPRGIALIIVMIVILVLGVLAGGFAYSMRVETKLARNANFQPELDWIGRSGVEFGKYVLAQQLMVPNEPYTSLNQRWAGGPAGTNEVLASLSLEENKLGSGKFSVKIIDLERKFNINMINETTTAVLQRALEIAGVPAGDIPTVIDSYLDWRDTEPTEARHANGAESPDYLAQPNPGFPPHMAKNGLLDDVSELLFIRGVTPEIFWGPQGKNRSQRGGPEEDLPAISGGTGLVDLFTTLSAGPVNPNTASIHVLQIIPGLDQVLAQAIVATRAGPDGADGTEDDIPFHTPGELINVPGMGREIVGAVQRFFVTRSYTFEIQVDAEIGHFKRRYVAIVRRNSQRDIPTLYAYWE
jgi:general secretion pathway protein K